MAQATFYFPKGFLWGAATSAHQVEGNNTNNNWWAWEQEPGRIVNGHQSGLACDWWAGRWREDLDRADEGGHNAHRLSIEWSRIQPAPDRWDEEALDRYLDILRGLQQRGLTPMVTLHHFTDPLWLEQQGGWQDERAVPAFAKYVQKTVEALKEYTNLWVTINEPNVLGVMGYLMGVFPPGKKDLGALIKATANMVRAHAEAYRLIHKIQPQARVGVAYHYRGFRPAKPWFLLDRLVAQLQDSFFNRAFPTTLVDGKLRFPGRVIHIPSAKGTQDFFGLNYYTRTQLAFDLSKPGGFFSRSFFPPGADLSDTGFLANDPAGFEQALRWARTFNLPILITENGVENADDRLRPRYLIEHIHQVWRAITFNTPVKGYFHWTLVDNFEWERGWTQRFGLWELDPQTQARRKRPSADMFAEICRLNGISSDIVARFAPEIYEKMFPN